MNCPKCGKPMKNQSYDYYSIAGWDCDYPDEHCEQHVCKTCKIKFVDGVWTLPTYMRATDAQMRTAEIIRARIGGNFPPPTKQNMWKYINDNMHVLQQRNYTRY